MPVQSGRKVLFDKDRCMNTQMSGDCSSVQRSTLSFLYIVGVLEYELPVLNKSVQCSYVALAVTKLLSYLTKCSIYVCFAL